MKYYVDDIRQVFEGKKEIEANSPLEAVRKAFPNCKASRDFTNTGDVVVGGYTRRGYVTYVYNITKD